MEIPNKTRMWCLKSAACRWSHFKRGHGSEMAEPELLRVYGASVIGGETAHSIFVWRNLGCFWNASLRAKAPTVRTA